MFASTEMRFVVQSTDDWEGIISARTRSLDSDPLPEMCGTDMLHGVHHMLEIISSSLLVHHSHVALFPWFHMLDVKSSW